MPNLPERSRAAALGLGAALALIGATLYASTVSLSFFWEDPFDIGQVDGRSYADLLTTPNSNSYYRPLTLALFKLLRESPLGSQPATYHLPIVAAHIAASVLLFGFARRVFRANAPSFAAALLFLLYPPGYEAVARATSHHPWPVALTIAALWLYAVGREEARRGLIAAALAAATLAMFMQENAVVLFALLVPLELYLRHARRTASLAAYPALFLIPAAVFALIWISIPKPIGEAVEFTPTLGKFLYLSQGASFPLAAIAPHVPGQTLDGQAQATLALIATAAILIAGYARRKALLLMFVSWWLIGIALAWFTRTADYLDVSPRVMYFSAFAAAMAWGGLLDVPRPRLTPGIVARYAIVCAVALQSLAMLGQSVALYGTGSALMRQIVDAGRGGGARLFVNVPDRFAYRRPLYPLGYWGMLLAPVSQDLGDFVALAGGGNVETRSLTTRPLVESQIVASPYIVNTRGVEAFDSARLYDLALWADRTYSTRYQPDGAMGLGLAGDVAADPAAAPPLGAIGNVAQPVTASTAMAADVLTVTVEWRAIGTAQPTDDIFVQLIGPDGRLVAQADGASLDGLIRPSAWRPGHGITDVRRLRLAAPLGPGMYKVIAGVYSRVDGKRLHATDAAGQPAPDDAIEIARFAVGPA